MDGFIGGSDETMRHTLSRVLDTFRGPLRPRILVTGLQKSGTTAVAMLLGEAAGLTVKSDPFYRLDVSGARFRERLYGGDISLKRVISQYRHAFRGDVVKEPEFAYFLPALLDAFDRSQFVFIVRDPRDNIRSILNRLDLPGRPQEAGDAVGRIPSTWRSFVSGTMPSIDCGNYVRCSAERWKLMAQAYMAHRSRLRLVRYEDFVRDKSQVVDATLADLGIASRNSIEHIMDVQFQPKGNSSVRLDEFFGREMLEMIEDVCGEEMRALGY